MACTTILVGKNASYDGSTMIARNDDSGAGHYMPKKFVVVHPEDRQKVYRLQRMEKKKKRVVSVRKISFI